MTAESIVQDTLETIEPAIRKEERLRVLAEVQARIEGLKITVHTSAGPVPVHNRAISECLTAIKELSHE